MKKRLKIYFTDFWDTFKLEDNYFLNLIKNEYDIEIDPVNPDFLFYSNFGINHFKYKCVRIYFTGENVRPDFNECDWAFSFDYSDDERNFRFPLYGLFADMNELTRPKDPEKLFYKKSEFCNFIYSNPGPKKRKELFLKLSQYKQVHSAGRYLNNIGGPIGGFENEKREFISRYKFTFAFENSSYPGYTTEKILDPLLCGSIPIYWGNKEVSRDFNPKSFINYHDYENDEGFIEKIIEYDNNKQLYLDMLAEPAFENNTINEFVDKKNVLEKLKYIFSRDIVPVAEKSPLFSENKLVSNLWAAGTRLKYNSDLIRNKVALFSFDRVIVKAHKIKERYFKKD